MISAIHTKFPLSLYSSHNNSASVFSRFWGINRAKNRLRKSWDLRSLLFYASGESSLCGTLLCDSLIHFIKLLIGERILVNKVTYNYEKNCRNDCGEPQDCILNS